jgi:hypothetical protein
MAIHEKWMEEEDRGRLEDDDASVGTNTEARFFLLRQ